MTTHEEMIKEGWTPVYIENPKNLDELYVTYDNWLHLEDKDKETIEVVLAATLDRDIPGDPLWIYIISPSGGFKTELVRALNKYDKVYTLDSITPATFISGKVAKRKEDGKFYPVAGILKSLDGKVLVIKDFTVILSSPDIVRTEIYGQLRGIQDGYLEKAFGTLKEPIRIHAKIGLIMAVTPAIDHYTKAHNILGERFLKIRQHPDMKKTAERAFKNLGQETQMREDLATATAYYLNHVRQTKPYPKTTNEQMNRMIQIAHYIALMRTRVMGHYSYGVLVEPYFTEPEVPTRVAKQLKKLIIGLAIVRQHNEITEDDMTTIQRVAKDCSIPIRQKIVDALRTFLDKEVLAFQLQHATKLPLNTVKNELIKMTLLGIVEERTLTEGKDNLTFYSFTRDFEELYNAVK